jgi:hypothetical protein
MKNAVWAWMVASVIRVIRGEHLVVGGPDEQLSYAPILPYARGYWLPVFTLISPASNSLAIRWYISAFLGFL